MKISYVMMLVVSMLAFCGCGDSRERLDINIEKGDSVVTMRLCFMRRARSWDRWHGQTRLNARREAGENIIGCARSMVVPTPATKAVQRRVFAV